MSCMRWLAVEAVLGAAEKQLSAARTLPLSIHG
jgi:hypothetical protein